MDITTLLSVVYAKISASTSTEEILILSKIAEKIKIGNVRIVTNYSDMFDNTYFKTGTLFFVESEEKIYYASGNNRIPLLIINSGIFSWGINTSNQLGDNTSANKSSPVSVVGGFTDWIQLSVGGNHTLGLRSNGAIWSWGSNIFAQLGDNTTVSRASPVSVVGGFTDWIQVSAGSGHNLGLRSNGTTWAWGYNTNGNLGDGTVIAKSSPVSVVGGFTDWIQVSAGGNHSLGIRKNGAAWAWGRNLNGQLGDNTSTSRLSPVSVVGNFTDWVQISAGGNHSLGLRSNGTIWAWGLGLYGRLGDNTIIDKSSPVSVVGGFTDWIQVNTGTDHSLGLRSNGTAWAWGYNAGGRLGDTTISTRSSPVSVVGGFTDWVQIEGGGAHSLGLRSNGTIWAWGFNSSGQLGDNTIVSKLSPVSVIGGFTDWIQIGAGGVSSALRTFR